MAKRTTAARLLTSRVAARSNRSVVASSMRTGIGLVATLRLFFMALTYINDIRCQRKKMDFFSTIVYQSQMADTQPIPVRLPDELINRLDAAAKRIGTTRAGIIRFCVETWLRHFEIKGKTASLPIDWEEILRTQDGRRKYFPRPGGGLSVSLTADDASISVLNEGVASVLNEHPAHPPKPGAGAPSVPTYRPSRGAGKSSKRRPSAPKEAPSGPKDGKV